MEVQDSGHSLAKHLFLLAVAVGKGGNPSFSVDTLIFFFYTGIRGEITL